MQTIAKADGQPDVDSFPNDVAAEPGLRDAGDRQTNAVDAHGAPDDGRIPMEAPRPVLVADRRLRRGAWLVGRGVERAPRGGAHAQNGEIVARDEAAVRMLGLSRRLADVCVDAVRRADGGEPIESVRVLADVEIQRIRVQETVGCAVAA